MRFSQAFIPTLKEKPAEAEIPSHTLMIRSGMLRKLGSGIYSYLPLAKKVINYIETIVREELDDKGCQEILMPVLHPRELWEMSGRWAVYGPELMRLTDRHDREFALGPTHEEVITLIAKYDIKSYKKLPINLYQIQTKFRDEIRPRFGVMRSREFIMKDAYSFDKDKAGLQKSYDDMYDAYSRIFARCGLKSVAVEADVGAIGGSSSHEFMVLAETGESEVLHCECGYAATSENAKIAPFDDHSSEDMKELAKIHTPDRKSVEEVSAYLGVLPEKLIKTIVYKADDGFVAILIRGDREINNVKLANFLQCLNLEFATEQEIENIVKSVAGFVGPVGKKKIKIYADENLKSAKNMVTGADELDYHYKNVNLERDAHIDKWVDLVQAVEGDLCPKCGKPMTSFRGIEVGQIFQLGDKYSTSMEATYDAEDGTAIPYQMGCYGIGITRTMAAAIEQFHDKDGIIWPISISPYEVELINLSPAEEDITSFCDNVYEMLQDVFIDVLYDDRDEKAGFKFKDADLIGIPIHIIVGKKNFENEMVEIKIRKTGEKITCAFDDIVEKVEQLIDDLYEEIDKNVE
ncbi:MAG: proline--tRNA ligase [Candidatus Cloacimonetes bacterium]|nr:proline--tRNA ligase [Candidatus Cloacimonadota bacterium]